MSTLLLVEGKIKRSQAMCEARCAEYMLYWYPPCALAGSILRLACPSSAQYYLSSGPAERP